MTATIEQRLKRLEDTEEIRNLLKAYGRTLDAREFAAYAQLFAKDGEWIAGSLSAKTPAGIQAMLERAFGNASGDLGMHHVFSNETIEVDGDAAEARSRWATIIPSKDGKPTVRSSGQYYDQLVREDGAWKFKRRTLVHDIEVAPRK